MKYENHFSVFDEVEKDLLKLQKSIAIEILNRIVLLTPVDEGRARGNWLVSLGYPDSSEQDIYDESGRGTIVHGTGIIKGVKDLGYIYIQNNLPYIEFLNDGGSSQADRFFIETAIHDVVSKIK